MAKPQPKPKQQPKSSKPQPKSKPGTALMSPKDIGIAKELEDSLTKSDNIAFMNLMQGTSEGVGEIANVGEYVLNKTTNCGDEFFAVIGPSRPRAMIFENKKFVLDTFDPSSEEWARCKATKKGGNTGIEFLCYNPDFGTFTFYFKNTSRTVGAKAVAAREEACWAKFSSKKVPGKDGDYFVPVVESADPLEPSDVPSGKDWDKAVADFESYKLEKKAPKMEER